MRIKKSFLGISADVLNTILKLIVIAVIAFPFFWMISTSLKSLAETLRYPPTIVPEAVHWENFSYVLERLNILQYLKNSLIVCVCVVFLQYLIIVPCAYSLSRYSFRAKPMVFALVLLGQMIPQQITFLPVYFMFSRMRLLDSYTALILPFISNPFGIFMLRQYFLQVPQEIIEAAKLDDANDFKIMFRIMMPMVKPALITIGLLAFISNWNSYFWPLIMTSKDAFRTLPVGIAMLRDADGLDRWNYIMAGNMVLVVPMLFIYFAASKKIRNSFVYSGIK